MMEQHQATNRGRLAGRPPKAPQDKMDVEVRVLMTRQEREVIRAGTKAATASSMSSFLRTHGLAAAEKALRAQAQRNKTKGT